MHFTKFAFKASLYFVGISIALSVVIILGHKAYIAIFAESYSAFQNPWGRDDYALRILNKSYVLDEEVWNKNLYVANEFKELRCIEDETKIPNLYGLSEIGTKLGDKLMDEEVIHVPTENKFLKNAIRDQYMTAGYIEKGEMHGNHIEKMKLAQVQTEGGNDYFLIEDGELLSILSTTEKVALRMDRHKLTEIEYTNEFTPEIFERVEKNATLLTQEEKEPPLKKLYKDTPEIKLKEGVTSLEQVNYIPKFRGKEQTQS